MQRPYYSFNQYLRERYPFRVQKIPLAAGFTCPNIDGTAGTGGCLYCNNRSFSPNAGRPGVPIAQQIREGIARYRRYGGAIRFIAYFQAHSNTYAPLSHLRALYEEAFSEPGVIGLSVGTRPDCVPEPCLALLEGYRERGEVWIEFGMESAHDRTLLDLNRCHDFSTTADAVHRARRRGLKVCAHVILGLPGEDREMMMETARRLGALAVDAVKIHHLYVAKNTRLERRYREGKVVLFSLQDYLPLLAEFLEWLPETTIIQRLVGELDGPYVVAPRWGLAKAAVHAAIDDHMRSRGLFQGRLWRAARSEART